MSARSPMTLGPLPPFLRPRMTPTTPVLPMPGHHFVAAECLQLLSHVRRSALHVEQDFRVRMDVAPPCGDFCLHVGDTLDDGHGELLGTSGPYGRGSGAVGYQIGPLSTGQSVASYVSHHNLDGLDRPGEHGKLAARRRARRTITMGSQSFSAA